MGVEEAKNPKGPRLYVGLNKDAFARRARRWDKDQDICLSIILPEKTKVALEGTGYKGERRQGWTQDASGPYFFDPVGRKSGFEIISPDCEIQM